MDQAMTRARLAQAEEDVPWRAGALAPDQKTIADLRRVRGDAGRRLEAAPRHLRVGCHLGLHRARAVARAYLIAGCSAWLGLRTGYAAERPSRFALAAPRVGGRGRE